MFSISDKQKLQFYDELMENSNVAILVADRKRQNIFVNQLTCEMFGYTKKELIGQPTEIFHISPKSAQEFGEIVLEAVLHGESVGVDYQWRRKDGTTFWGHIAGSVTKESQEVLWTLFDVSDRVEAEAIQLRNAQQAQIIEQINEAVITTDLQGIITSWNYGATLLSGYESQEIIGKPIQTLYRHKDLQELQEGMIKLQKHGNFQKERVMVKKDGSHVEVLLSLSLLRNENGNATHMIGYVQDISIIKKAQATLLHSDMFYSLVENAFVAIYIIHEGKFIYTNKKFLDVFGYSEDEMLNKPSKELIHPDDIELVMSKLKERTSHIGLGIEYSFRGMKKSGELLDAHVYGSSLILEDNKKAVIGTLTDDTEKNLVKKQLEVLANKDTLTDLFNRNYFNTQLEHAINLAQRHTQKLALILFDIDNFKRVNDSLGHIAGDYIIKQTAQRISKILRKSDTFFRIGGDEFTIIIENYKSISELTTLLSRIHEVMKESIEIENIAFHISLSLGVSLFPENGNTSIKLQRAADLAMYEVKNNGKNSFVFYHSNDLAQLERVKLEGELFEAFENGDFELYLQAQVSSTTEELLGAEALIRWNHSKKGIIFPDIFLGLAEEVGILYKLDLFMLEEGLKLLHKYAKTEKLSFTISINISNALFLHQKFISQIKVLTLKYKKEVEFIQLELTEDIAMNNENYSREVIKTLKYLGFKISIDDFGTGYSSLNHLKMLDVDELKIDKSFIDEISTNKTDRSIVKAMIDMSKALSLKSVAEGVETIEQLNVLKDMECDLIQGYYFSKPLSISEFESKWL